MWRPSPTLLTVEPEYLQAAFDAVAEQYGDWDTYLTENLGLTPDEIEAFREQLLE